MRLLSLASVLAPLCLSLVASVACQGGAVSAIPDPPQIGQMVFESDDPTGRGSTDLGGDTGAAAPPTPSDGASKDAASRAIAEADIIQLRGGRLYALSRYGGLSVIDVSKRDALRFLGRYRTSAMPFEMYVRDDVVLAMYNDFGSWEVDDALGYGSWKQSSRIVALDVRDPAHIARIGDFVIPGQISDSRMVGDVLYAVSHENGYCWRCRSNPTTSVLSLDIADPRAIVKADQVAFESPNKSVSWWRRSVTVTTNRMYVAGIDWNWDSKSKPHSTIQVLDISDAHGKLVVGAAVPVDGQITSRWQMDETAGVLRVVSQAGSGWWSTGVSPMVETFKVASAAKVTPLGKMALKLPKPETLQTVRFDGDHAFAITTERKDPLFTIDLSDPANPVQMGELEMPGWVYYIEPRGNRLLGLGFDQGNPDGAMTVSLFDVTSLKTPKMLKRVNFGKGWASAPEDSDRIHKAFGVLDSEKLVTVPFSSFDWRATNGVCHRATSGVQLIDWKDDTLALRGLATLAGSPRRAFLHDQRLFAVSDNQVATFDIKDRDAPAPKADFALSNPSHKSVVSGDQLVQLSHDWWSQRATLTVSARADVDAAPLGSIDLSPIAGDDVIGCTGYAWTSWWGARLFANGSYVYVVVPDNGYYDGKRQAYRFKTLVGVVDVSHPTKPLLVGRAAFDEGTSYGGYGYGYGYYGYGYGGALLAAGDSSVRVGSTVATLKASIDYPSGSGQPRTSSRISLIDFSDPANPKKGPDVWMAQGSAYSPLQVADASVFTSHYEPTSNGRVRFYLDEIDVTRATPARKINTPGSLLAYDAPGGRAVTVDYRRFASKETDWETCSRGHPSENAYFDWQSKTCSWVQRYFRLVRLGRVDGADVAWLEASMPIAASVDSVAVGDARVFVHTTEYDRRGGSYYGFARSRVSTLSGYREGSLALSPSVVLDGGWGGGMWGRGSSAVVATGRSLAVVDATNPTFPVVTRKVDIPGYSVADVSLAADAAYCSLGDFGVMTLPLK